MLSFTCQWKLLVTHLGNIWATSLSVFCLSTSSSSVLSLIRSSRLEEYCSNIRSIESMMLVFFPLVMLLNCRLRKGGKRNVISSLLLLYRATYSIRRSRAVSACVFSVFTCLKISSKVGLFSGSSLQACFIICITSSGASSTDTTGRHKGGGSLTLLIISGNTSSQTRTQRYWAHTEMLKNSQILCSQFSHLAVNVTAYKKKQTCCSIFRNNSNSNLSFYFQLSVNSSLVEDIKDGMNISKSSYTDLPKKI